MSFLFDHAEPEQSQTPEPQAQGGGFGLQNLIGNAGLIGMLPGLGGGEDHGPEVHCGHDHGPSTTPSAPGGTDSWFPSFGQIAGGLLGGALGGPLGALAGGWLGGKIEEGIKGLFGPGTPQGSGLGKDVDDIVNKSPTLKANIEALQKQGYTISYGEKGKGTYVNKDGKSIVIDENEKGNPLSVVQSLAHESGHAMYTADPYVGFDGKTRDEYVAANVNSNLKDEGEATIMNLIVREELMKNDPKMDIGVAGAQAEKYKELYEKNKDKISDPAERDKLRQTIGDAFADGEHPSTDTGKTYRQYYAKTYEDHWDKHHP